MALYHTRRTMIVFFILWVFCGLATWQASAQQRSLDEIIAGLETRQQTVQACHMPFTHQRTSSLLLQPQTRSGVMYFDRNAGIAIHYQHPQSYTLLLADNSAYMLQTNKIEKLDTEQNPMFNGLSDFFHADFSMLQTYFTVTELREKNSMVSITFEPKRKMGIAKLRMTINEQQGTIDTFVIEESSGDRQVMTFGQPVFEPVETELFTLSHWSNPELAQAYEAAPR